MILAIDSITEEIILSPLSASLSMQMSCWHHRTH